MASDPNKLSQFWKELKRRKVLRIITVYAAVAFVILQLVEILAPSLRLPEWTMNFILVLLIVGFIIAIILSWIYDIHPEEGIVKTESAQNVIERDVPRSSQGWRIASYISFVVILGLIVLNIIPRTTQKEIFDTSIAVLPFRNDSPDEENVHFINGIMESILDNFCRIEGLRVPGRTTVEQYRNNPKPIPEIAKELDVDYILEGSGQKLGNRILLTIQLIEAKSDQHLWSKQYDRVIVEVEDLIDIQAEIAQLVANELHTIITPQKMQIIETVPTTSLTALDLYQKARENQWEYWLFGDSVALQRAEDLYFKALDNDPTFALAYNGLAYVYWYKQGPEEYLTEEYLDSLLILTDIALSNNQNLSETYVIRGIYYAYRNNIDQAIFEIDKALKINPNEWMAYFFKARIYQIIDNLQSIKNYYKAINLNRGRGLSLILKDLSENYFINGFETQGKRYLQQYLDLTGDSSFYFQMSVDASFSREEDVAILKKAYRCDSSNREVVYLIGEYYSFLGKHEESLKYYEKCLELGGIGTNRYHRIAYAYYQNGDKEKADYYFDKQIEYCLADIKLGRVLAGTYFTYYDLAAVYAFRREKSKSYENLRLFNQKENMPLWLLKYIKSDPLFNSIRNEPEFQQIVRDVEAKYQAEHERIMQWLEENEML
jgi:TolB-like protein/Tfp pilus assembly protein PilF